MAGELSFIDGLVHTAAVRALTDGEVFSLDRQSLEALIERDAVLVYKVMRAIVRTVHLILSRMNFQHVEMAKYIYKQHARS